jgi:hypothetical protein
MLRVGMRVSRYVSRMKADAASIRMMSVWLYRNYSCQARKLSSHAGAVGKFNELTYRYHGRGRPFQIRTVESSLEDASR